MLFNFIELLYQVDFTNCYKNYDVGIIFYLDTAALLEAQGREKQRRSDGAMDHASALPPDVVTVLCQCDTLEDQREDIHQKSHNKLSEIIGRFFSKLQAESKRYRTRMDELQVSF